MITNTGTGANASATLNFDITFIAWPLDLVRVASSPDRWCAVWCDQGRLNREKWSVVFGQRACILPIRGKLLSGFAA
jgi:hypothetical protein